MPPAIATGRPQYEYLRPPFRVAAAGDVAPARAATPDQNRYSGHQNHHFGPGSFHQNFPRLQILKIGPWSRSSQWSLISTVRYTSRNYLCQLSYHIAVKAYQVPTCTGTRSPILLRLVCGRTPVATLGMWADPGIYLLGTWVKVGSQKLHTLILFQYNPPSTTIDNPLP